MTTENLPEGKYRIVLKSPSKGDFVQDVAVTKQQTNESDRDARAQWLALTGPGRGRLEHGRG